MINIDQCSNFRDILEIYQNWHFLQLLLWLFVLGALFLRVLFLDEFFGLLLVFWAGDLLAEYHFFIPEVF